MRELPRELSADELAELFEARTRFVERLAAEPDPLIRARTLVHELPVDEKREILAAHPAIGQRTGLSARSAAEQGTDADPEVLAELARRAHGEARALADRGMRGQNLALLVRGELVDERARTDERIRLGGEPLDEARPALEEPRQLLGGQLPR